MLVAYESGRGFCALAGGILVGIGEHYEEPFHVEERQCTHVGAPRCEFLVTKFEVATPSETTAERTPRVQNPSRSISNRD